MLLQPRCRHRFRAEPAAVALLVCASVQLSAEAFTASPIANMLKLAHGPKPKQVDYDTFVNTDASSCSCTAYDQGCRDVANLGQTIVTMLVAIERPGKSWPHYLRNFKRLMSWFPNTPMIAFIEEGYAKDLIAAHPSASSGSKEVPNLCMIELTVKDLPEYSFIQNYAADLYDMYQKVHAMRFPESILPVYDALTNSKFGLMHRAVLSNPFKSKRWAWLDGGLHWPMDVSLAYIDPAIKIEGKCLWNEVCHVDDMKLDIQTCEGKDGQPQACIGFNHPVSCKIDEWRTWLGGTSGKAKLRTTIDCWNCQNGATFTGTKEAIIRMATAARKTLQEYHDQHVVDADQGVQMQLFLNTDVVQDVKCRGFKFCTGFMLGAWKRQDKEDREKMMWQEDGSECNKKDEIDNVKIAMSRAEKAHDRRLLV